MYDVFCATCSIRTHDAIVNAPPKKLTLISWRFAPPPQLRPAWLVKTRRALSRHSRDPPPAWLVKTRRDPSRHIRDARVYDHTTAVMHKLSTPLPPRSTAVTPPTLPSMPRGDPARRDNEKQNNGMRRGEGVLFPRVRGEGSQDGHGSTPGISSLARELWSAYVPRLTKTRAGAGGCTGTTDEN